jgi:hypothetical protein
LLAHGLGEDLGRCRRELAVDALVLIAGVPIWPSAAERTVAGDWPVPAVLPASAAPRPVAAVVSAGFGVALGVGVGVGVGDGVGDGDVDADDELGGVTVGEPVGLTKWPLGLWVFLQAG